MKNLITKLVYFLLKFIREDVTSFEQFFEGMEKIAKDRYFTARVEKLKHTNAEPTYEFTGYIDGKNHLSASTPSEVLAMFSEPIESELKIKELVD